MRVRVSFRYNSNTGEVERFIVDSVGTEPDRAGHNADHVRAAAEIGRVLDPLPAVTELEPESAARALEYEHPQTAQEDEETPARRRAE